MHVKSEHNKDRVKANYLTLALECIAVKYTLANLSDLEYHIRF